MPRGKKERANGTGSIYERPGSSCWQMAYRVNGNVEQEPTGCTNKKQAQDKLNQRLAEVQVPGGGRTPTRGEPRRILSRLPHQPKPLSLLQLQKLTRTSTFWHSNSKP